MGSQSCLGSYSSETSLNMILKDFFVLLLVSTLSLVKTSQPTPEGRDPEITKFHVTSKIQLRYASPQAGWSGTLEVLRRDTFTIPTRVAAAPMASPPDGCSTVQAITLGSQPRLLFSAVLTNKIITLKKKKNPPKKKKKKKKKKK